MKAVIVVTGCPKIHEYPVSHGLVRTCAVCFHYGGETETHIHCSYPSLFLEKALEEEIADGPDTWDTDNVEIPNSLMKKFQELRDIAWKAYLKGDEG